MLVKRILLSLALISLILIPAFSATYYDNGSQRFTITAGAELPLSLTQLSTGESSVGLNISGTKLSLGGYGAITYQMFMNDYVALGGELGYAFNFVVDDSIFTMVPMQAKASFFPVQGTIDIPLSIGVGAAYLSKSGTQGGSHMALFASFEVGLDYYFTDNWGLGFKSGAWLVPELFAKQTESSKNYLATFIPLTLAVTYRQ